MTKWINRQTLKGDAAVEQITYSLLNECFDLNVETGVLTWKTRPDDHFQSQKVANSWNKRMAGRTAGCVRSKTRKARGLVVSIYQRSTLCHRVVYALYHKIGLADVPPILDHINGNAGDNRPENLREATPRQNCWNSTGDFDSESGIKGVRREKRHKRWVAEISVYGKRVHLGLFKDPKMAAACYAGAAKILHGDYYRPTSVDEVGLIAEAAE